MNSRKRPRRVSPVPPLTPTPTSRFQIQPLQSATPPGAQPSSIWSTLRGAMSRIPHPQKTPTAFGREPGTAGEPPPQTPMPGAFNPQPQETRQPARQPEHPPQESHDVNHFSAADLRTILHQFEEERRRETATMMSALNIVQARLGRMENSRESPLWRFRNERSEAPRQRLRVKTHLVTTRTAPLRPTPPPSTGPGQIPVQHSAHTLGSKAKPIRLGSGAEPI